MPSSARGMREMERRHKAALIELAKTPRPTPQTLRTGRELLARIWNLPRR